RQGQGGGPGGRRPRPGGGPLRVPDGPPAVPGGDGHRHHPPGAARRPAAAVAAAGAYAAGPGDDLPEVPGEGPPPPLPQRTPPRRHAGPAGRADARERSLAGRPLVARPLSGAGHGVKGPRRRPAPAGLLAVMGTPQATATPRTGAVR